MFRRDCLKTNPFINVDQTTFNHDIYILDSMRQNINNSLARIDLSNVKSILEIGPSQDETKRFNYLRILKNVDYETLNIVDDGSTYCHDITTPFPENFKKFDLILLSEVLEHTLNPFSVMKNLAKILNKEGRIFVSFPFNFRLHGPLPDCWRISEFGFKSIINESGLKIESLEALTLEERPYFPIHYTSIVTHE